jgi:hypothetical protein
MPNQKMNPDEIDVGTPVVGRLIAEQFPHWAGLPITEVSSAKRLSINSARNPL